jgi:hypothetical protein
LAVGSDIAGSSTEARWTAALDELEASIERYAQLALTAYGSTETALSVPAAYVLPEDLGPMPEDLRARAEELIGRSDAVHTELHRVREVMGAQMAGLAKAPVAHAYHDDREPSYLDELG